MINRKTDRVNSKTKQLARDDWLKAAPELCQAA